MRKHKRSCHVCQKMAEKGSVCSASVQSPTLSSYPFQRVAIDIVGELHQISARGHRFILSLIDTCSRWVEAVPLKYIAAESVATALIGIFCCMGFPDVILFDNGSQFVSRTMRGFTDMLSILNKCHCLLKLNYFLTSKLKLTLHHIKIK